MFMLSKTLYFAASFFFFLVIIITITAATTRLAITIRYIVE